MISHCFDVPLQRKWLISSHRKQKYNYKIKMEKIKTLIIGSGPAGYTAAIYAGRANLQPVLYSGMQPGGQLTITTEVENFPGYPNGVDGTQMMMDMKEQAVRFGAEMRDGSIVKADFSSRPFHLTDERDNEIEAETVIIATGASAKYLGLADEEKYRGQGVSACATCDGFFYRKRTVAVVGGGDTACEEAMYLSGLAKKVYMIVRKPYLRASEIMQQRVKNKENIEILFETNTLGLFGENGVEGAHLVRHKGEATRRSLTSVSTDSSWLSDISLTPTSSRADRSRRAGLHQSSARYCHHQHSGCFRCRRCGRPNLPPGCCCRRLGSQGCHRGRQISAATVKTIV